MVALHFDVILTRVARKHVGIKAHSEMRSFVKRLYKNNYRHYYNKFHEVSIKQINFTQQCKSKNKQPDYYF